MLHDREIVLGVTGGIAAYSLHARGAIHGPRELGQPEAKPRFATAANGHHPGRRRLAR